ncbi:OX-2 membrane glycoprotein-like [Girardinichthys multiradiatus]|uniref:OX-2 membrane glycoprotein-like n=1 Tax=Girardinichthys multiradiatus TaxID=208333 RepID=UPI001FAE5D5C|nr:OX-2 membrane glycoprotein-like [Girardinichthys multiradiatus]
MLLGGNLVLIFFLVTRGGSFQKGLAEPIKTEKSVLAAEGEDAPLSCQLLETKNVQQVTWQKILENTERNICTYSEFFGETVDPDFKEKVQFTEVGLQKSSIVIKSVTEQDEGCYLCLFTIYPDGALTAGTCLMVYELHEPILDVRKSNSPAESVVSCSATGRPAPSVTLTVLHQNLSFSQYNSTSVTNSNGTVTITTTALLSAFSSTEVGCSVSVLSAAPRELLVTVPGLTETSEDGLDKQTGSSDRRSRWPLIIPFIMMMMMMMGVIFIFLLRKGLQRRNNKHSQDATGNQKPDSSAVSDNKDLRLRTSERQK